MAELVCSYRTTGDVLGAVVCPDVGMGDWVGVDAGFPGVPEDESAGDSSTMNVSIRVAHPKDVSAPNDPSQ